MTDGGTRTDRVAVLGLVLTIAGVIMLAVSVGRALPPLNFGTGVERASIERGRELLPIPLTLLLAAAVPFFLRRRLAACVVVGACGAVPVFLAFFLPDAGWGLVASWILVPSALILAVMAVIQGRRRIPR